jgi:hypothetical protein
MNQTEYYETHPPRCLAAFTTHLGDFEKGEFDGHGPGHINTTFRLSCPCGSDQHVIHLYAWTDPDHPDQTIILSPLNAECVACQKKSLVFDSDIHGYNPEAGVDHGLRCRKHRMRVTPATNDISRGRRHP